MILYLRLFWEFFKTGLFAVGGGLATLPFLSDLAVKTGWFTQAQLADMVAVAESTPGPIGVNTATYVGFTTGGIPGAVIATVGLVTPSIIIIMIIAAFLEAFSDNRFVVSVFRCLRPASVALVSVAGLAVAKIALLDQEALAALEAAGAPALSLSGLPGFLNFKAIVLFVIFVGLIQFAPKIKKWHPIIFIGISAVIGILLF